MTTVFARFRFAVRLDVDFVAKALEYYQYLLLLMANRASSVREDIELSQVNLYLEMPEYPDMQALDRELLNSIHPFLGSPIERQYDVNTTML